MIDKPAGPTSHDVVARVRRILGTKAVGHTGTLDPFATGLLVLLVGPATRLAQFVEGLDKTYYACIRLGTRTSTDDLTGEILPSGAAGEVPVLPVAEVLAGLQRLVGPQHQRPPAYSAKKVSGERSYVRARRGEVVELPAVPVVVHSLELLSHQGSDLEIRARVSAGTYLRGLARDLGEWLGCGAHLVALRREAIGPLRVEDALPLEQVTRETPLLSPQAVLPHLPVLELSADEAAAIRHGRSVARPGCPEGVVALMEAGLLVAVASGSPTGLRPLVVPGGA